MHLNYFFFKVDFGGGKIEAFYNKKISKENAFVLEQKDVILKRGDKFSLVSDAMFEAMINNKKRIKYGAYLISLVFKLDFNEVMKTIRIEKSSLDIEVIDEGKKTVDFVCNIKGEYYNIEMNNYKSKEALIRNMYYGMEISRSATKRGSKKYKYKRVYQINLCNFTFIGYDKIYQRYGIYDEEGNKMIDELNYINIYLPNLKKECYNDEKEVTTLERLLMVYCSSKKEAKWYARGDEIMEEYIKEAEEASKEYDIQEEYDIEERREREMQDEKEHDIKWAKIEGREEGRKEQQIEIAKKLLVNNVSLDIISSSTGLSKDEIEKLK